MLKELGDPTPAYKIRDMIKEVDLDENGTVEFDEFLAVSEGCVNTCVCRDAMRVALPIPLFHCDPTLSDCGDCDKLST